MIVNREISGFISHRAWPGLGGSGLFSIPSLLGIPYSQVLSEVLVLVYGGLRATRGCDGLLGA